MGAGTSGCVSMIGEVQYVKEVAVSVLPFDHPAARAAATMRAELERRGRPIGPLDNLIAGTALAHRATLVTRNTREFSRLPNLAVLDWYG